MKNYVKEYAGFQVPDGAKYFTEDSRIQRVGFYKWNADELMFYSVSNYGKWEKSINSEVPSCAIELPEAQQEWNGEGLPHVGDKCEISHDGRIRMKCLINYISESIVVCTYESGAERAYSTKDIAVFLPVKTQEQKDREAFIDKALEEIETKAGLVAPDKAIFEIMHEAGFTAPKAGDNE